jgi:hypothetical protein
MNDDMIVYGTLHEEIGKCSWTCDLCQEQQNFAATMHHIWLKEKPDAMRTV